MVTLVRDISIDAIPKKIFQAAVTEIGNNAIVRSTGVSTSQQTSASQEAKDFKVVVTLQDGPENLRPGLSATAKITTATRSGILTIPNAIAMSAAAMAPVLAVVLNAPAAVPAAGAALPLSFLLAFVAAALVGNTVVQFSRVLPSAGSFYTFNSRGLGPAAGAAAPAGRLTGAGARLAGRDTGGAAAADAVVAVVAVVAVAVVAVVVAAVATFVSRISANGDGHGAATPL